ncbi:MAG: FHA domain-containing protein [Dehalococcoidia bacterium]
MSEIDDILRELAADGARDAERERAQRSLIAEVEQVQQAARAARASNPSPPPHPAGSTPPAAAPPASGLPKPAAARGIELEVDGGPRTGQRVSLAGPLLAGSAPDNGLILEGAGVARRHALFEPDGDGVRVVDLGGGVTIDGSPVRGSALVHPGSLVKLGPAVVRIVDTSEADTLETVTWHWEIEVSGAIGPARRRRIEKRLNIGRAPDNDLVLEAKPISRYHASIEVDRSGIRVQDLRSTNGTRVNGRKIAAAVTLAPDDEITIGGFRLLVCRVSEGQRRGGAGQ